ncbi:MAG: hypothetical protein OXJ64_06355 [Boseongicola sp.]|nr:hypothetical protein [Boseongicola sp.]
MKVVIQCAKGKRRDAGRLRTVDGRSVMFVARPEFTMPGRERIHAKPDDPSDTGRSWRAVLEEYNASPKVNPLGLMPAWQLYKDRTYRLLFEHCGPERLYILSAGWGLIRSDFLTPDYDITFSGHRNVEVFKRRTPRDEYDDFNMLPRDSKEPITFFGGRAYIRQFCTLTDGVKAERHVWYNSSRKPIAPGCFLSRFDTRTRTNWHYECAQAYMHDGLKFGGDRC